MFYDASVRVYRTSDTDPGFQPNNPSSPDPTTFEFRPQGEAKRWYPALANADAGRRFKGYYRWTRGGLKGRDVGAAATPTPGAAQAFEASLFERVFR